MRKITLLLIYFTFFYSISFAQIVIDQHDMPNVGDTIRCSTTYSTNGVDYTLTGQDYTWDFSELNYVSQKVDTFVHVWSTPLTYQLVFLYPFVATIASPQADFDLIPNFEITEAYQYCKETSSEYKEVGTGFKLNGIPLPLKYDEPDILYKFPLENGDIDSCISIFEFDIPGIGHYSRTKKRINTVDGWGTLITPLGTFETLRIKSEIFQRDSLYIDSLGFGFPINSSKIEYKWLAKEFGIPLLTITKSGILPPTVKYIDFNHNSLAVDIGPDITICKGESVGLKAYASGGHPPYYYFWNTISFNDSINVSPEETSTYIVTVMDSWFSFATDSVTVFVNPPPVVDAGEDVSIILTTNTTLNGSVISGEPPYSYYWSPETGLSDPYISNPVASPMITTTYTLSVTDGNACIGEDDVTVTVIQVPLYYISGTITDSETGLGISDVIVNFDDNISVVTNNTGFYYRTVYEGWSGTAVPMLEYYTFIPENIIYNNVTSNYGNQDYIGICTPPPTYTISGIITNSETGTGAYGILLEFTGLDPVLTNENGYYEKTVIEGWSGTVTPITGGFTYVPEFRTYPEVYSDQINQDYVRIQNALPPGWQFTETDKWHVIYIPLNANPNIQGVPLAAGDYIGIFYIDDNNNEVCGGAVEWTGSGTVTLTAYGDDENTPEKDGFEQLEDFIWKMFSWDEFEEYYAHAEYFWLLINDGKFHNYGFSSLTSLDALFYNVYLKIFLEGPYNNTEMSTALNSNNLLPVSNPYYISPWFYPGNESIFQIPNQNIVDWILIEVRQTFGEAYTATGQTILKEKAVFLLNDGSAVDMDGYSPFRISANKNANIYIVVKHRNHLDVMSAYPMIFNEVDFSYDFSVNAEQVYGGITGHKEIGNGVWGLIGGDGNADNQVSNSDKHNIWATSAGDF
ncbi:MAG: hypothetical protein K8R58_07325 [Bacteroidales bacterium]|nr:hypothetical protein [Bacteroidales bacterium]